jgi:hypothetical protein
MPEQRAARAPLRRGGGALALTTVSTGAKGSVLKAYSAWGSAG